MLPEARRPASRSRPTRRRCPGRRSHRPPVPTPTCSCSRPCRVPPPHLHARPVAIPLSTRLSWEHTGGVTVRPPAVAGSFYPGQRSELTGTVERLLDEARRTLHHGDEPAKAYVLPHAGYVYSGSTAALGLRPPRALPRRRTARGAARPDAPGRRGRSGPERRRGVRDSAGAGRRGEGPAGDPGPAPAGRQPRGPCRSSTRWRCTCRSCRRSWTSSPWCPWRSARPRPDEVAEVLDALWGGPETVVVVSSDLSHYLSYDDAEAVDSDTVDQVLRLGRSADPSAGLRRHARQRPAARGRTAGA